MSQTLRETRAYKRLHGILGSHNFFFPPPESVAYTFEPYHILCFAGFGLRSVTRILWLKFDVFLSFCIVKSQGRRQSWVKFGKGGLTIYMEHSSEKSWFVQKVSWHVLGLGLPLLYRHESWNIHLDSVMTLVVALTVVFRE